jgi:hypothetical protein
MVAMRDRLLVGLAIALLLSALVTAFPVLPTGHKAASATAAPVEQHVRVQVALPVGAFGGVGLGLVLLGGLLVADRGPARRERARTGPTR